MRDLAARPSRPATASHTTSLRGLKLPCGSESVKYISQENIKFKIQVLTKYLVNESLIQDIDWHY